MWMCECGEHRQLVSVRQETSYLLEDNETCWAGGAATIRVSCFGCERVVCEQVTELDRGGAEWPADASTWDGWAA